jgi:ketosteroid isomerase-like protein
MRNLLTSFVLLLLASMPAHAAQSARPAPADERRLLDLHEAGLKAHMDGDIDALLAFQADDFLLVDRGEISSLSKQDVRDFLGPYLASTKFEFYRDKVPPLVKVSKDGTLGWVAAQIEARGESMDTNGQPKTIEAVFAWIELYERRGDEWVSIGNATSFARD